MIQRLPLVAAQPGIWMAEALSTLPNMWSVAHYVALEGKIEAPLFAQAIVTGMEHADTLKMRFCEEKGEIWQWVDTSITFALPEIVDLCGTEDPHAAALALMQEDLQQNLRIDSGKPLSHHVLLRIGEQHWYWYQRYHHLLVDGFSFSAISRHIAAIYNAWRQNQPTPDSLFTPFADVVNEYQHYAVSPAYQRDKEYWTEQCHQLPAPATLATQPLAKQGSSHDVLRYHITTDRLAFQRLTSAYPQNTPADLALALVALWLGRLCGRMDYSAGFIFMRRVGSAALCATGPVINVLPLAVHISAAQSLSVLATDLAEQLKKMRRHQRYDAEQIARDNGRVVSNLPLFSAVFNIKLFDYQLNIDGISGITHTLASGPVKDLEIALFPDEQGLKIEILANQHCYDADELQHHATRLASLLQQFADNPQLSCGEADLVMPDEYQQLAEINDTHVDLDAATLSELVVRQAEKTPDAPALADAHWALNYREMREQVVTLALHLRQHGVLPGDSVAVALPRSVFLTLALHGIVEAGAAWLPLDTGYPDERLQMMLEDARPSLLITTQQQAERFRDIPHLAILCYQEFLPVSNQSALALSHPQHTAYIIFTSGSTGRPKGVMVGQRAIVNRLLWMQDHYSLGGNDVVAQKTPCSFDVSVWEFFWPFIAGAQLVMAEPEAHRDPMAMQHFFAHYGVTTTHFVPSMLAAFIASLTPENVAQSCGSLKRVFCSGEALPTELCREWQQLTQVPLHNLYGPTEAAVDVSYYPAYGKALDAVQSNSVPIGYPVWNTGLRILDAQLRPLPFGVAGDLYLTGLQLAQGYLGRPDLTASRFIADPFAAGQRMYRTGDVARRLENGAIEYLGRSDDQLKIRGQRIELGDIERVMQRLPNVAQAAAHACVFNQAAVTGGDARQLVGYLVAEKGTQLDDNEDLLQQLRQFLPAHMVPVVLLQLEQLPLSTNGKLDRKALPLPQLTSNKLGRAPQSAIELIIADAFSQLLACDIEDVQADFFALGGHSLLAMRLAALLNQKLVRQGTQQVTPGQIMVASTVEKLAALLESPLAEGQAQRLGYESLLPLRDGKGPILFCFHPASGFAWQFSILARYLDPRWAIIGIQSPRPNGPMAMASCLDEVCDQHLIKLLQRQPYGPYYLLGYSLGGTLAHHIAARLQARGEEVAFLGLLDTWPPESQNWSEKTADGLDPEVLAEIERERAAFIAVQKSENGSPLFDEIEANYADAVRLLTSAHSVPFAGKATMFVAELTRQAGSNPEQIWAPWVDEIEIYRQDCAHVDIISPQAFSKIGPIISDILP